MVREELVGDRRGFAPPPEPVGGRFDRASGAAEHEIVRSPQRGEQMVRYRIQGDVHLPARGSLRLRPVRVVEIGRLDISADLQPKLGGVGLRLQDFHPVRRAGAEP